MTWHRDPEVEARDKRRRRWLDFRRTLGLANDDTVARLLGLSTRTLLRYETAVHPPRWYHAALLGLIESWPDRAIARRFRPRTKPEPWAWKPEPKTPYNDAHELDD